MRRRKSVLVTTLALAAAMVLTGPAEGAPTSGEPTRSSQQYRVYGPKTFADRDAVARTGASIDASEHGILEITATSAEVVKIRGMGFTLEPIALLKAPELNKAPALAFPPADSN